MDARKILEELKFERDLVEDVILRLERFRSGGGKRRGRPPKWLQAARARQGNDTEPKPNKDKASEKGDRLRHAG